MDTLTDVSFLIEDYLNLYEHQSTENPNMPLRGLFYYSAMYKGYVDTHDQNIYSSTPVTIPTPRYIVFYNGDRSAPDSHELKLSDLFIKPLDTAGAYEWTATMLNINLEHNKALMEDCRPLWEYAYFVALVKEYQRELPIEAAIDYAVTQCIEKDILAQILKQHRSEVTEMLMSEYDEVKTMNLFKKEYQQEGIRIGEQRGLKIGEQKGKLEEKELLVKKMLCAGFDTTLIADMTELPPERILEIKEENKL
ncbi:MAG: hypothetical protein VB081_08870 [Christensenella sp.]|uniref:hypothetical protein n=1 Tax=Christensenella sp. TaxID=1935934 RepID=UPI002B1EC045|nr:hypothetical protein [Christensenella sp.]MEA5003597.1 hypothetical protein [Christensenella sp.]